MQILFKCPFFAFSIVLCIDTTGVLSSFSYRFTFVVSLCVGHRRNGSATPPRKRQQHNGVRNTTDNDTSGMFQVDYEYTPLKDYAAMQNGRSTNANSVNDGLSK
jgi:hypothetical protein